jgi:integrase/recombinase XerD
VTPLCLPLHHWPEGDRLAWENACRPGSLLDEYRAAANWAPLTRRSVAQSYGRWLAWLDSGGFLDPTVPPAARITRESVIAYVAELKACGLASSTIRMRILHLSRMLDVMASGIRPQWLGRVLRQLKAAIRPTRDDRARLVPAEVLLALGRRLIRQAETAPKLSPRLRAVAFRDGLMILILCACFLRVGNLALLQLGSSLVNRGGVWWVAFEPHETKNRRRIDLPVPPKFSALLDRFIEVWRPLLCRTAKDICAGKSLDPVLLWRGRYGGVFTAKKIGERISNITRRHLGHSMNPHLFRKMAPTELAIHDPEHVGLSQALLTHASYETTQKHYNLGRAIDAARRVQNMLEELRLKPAANKEP